MTTRTVFATEVPTTPMVISYERVSVAYDDGHGSTTVALEDVSFEIPKGSFTSIIGPSGCSKTTLLRLCAGFQIATVGQPRCNGDVVRELNHAVAYVTQHSNLCPWMTTRETWRFPSKVRSVPKEERSRRSDLYLHKMGLAAFTDAFPDSCKSKPAATAVLLHQYYFTAVPASVIEQALTSVVIPAIPSEGTMTETDGRALKKS